MADPAAAHPDEPGFALPLLLFAGFRTLIDRLHADLAAQGHPDLRPAHGFALQAIGRAGATASEMGRRLGVSKMNLKPTVIAYGRLMAAHIVGRIQPPPLSPLGLDTAPATTQRHLKEVA